MACVYTVFRDSCRGITLVELLVALAIGVLLSFAATHFLLRSKLSFLQSDEMARLRENGAYALHLLSRELMMSGYLAGELPGTSVDTPLSGTDCFDYLLDTSAAIGHVNDVSVDGAASGGGVSPPRDCLLPGQHEAGTDVLVVRRTAGSPVVQNGQRLAATESDAIYLRSGVEGLAPQIRRGAGSPLQGDLSEYLPAVFFLRSHSRVSGDGIPGLCRKRPGRSSNRMAPTECLVEGIENLQLEFGIDDDGDAQADRFEPAPTVAELPRAVAARIHLLVRSVNPVPGYIDDKSYTLGANRIAAARDGYVRRVVQATVQLRNSTAWLW